MGGGVENRDRFFQVLTASEFRREQIADLAAGRCAAIQVPGLFTVEVCEEILTALKKIEFEAYDAARVQPIVFRCGVGISDHRIDGRLDDSYWLALQVAEEMWSSLDLSYDVFARCREALRAGWRDEVVLGRHEGRPLGAGVVREPNGGFQVHYDDVLREFVVDLLDSPLIAQFAFNLYLEVPDAGGETVVWRHRWHPADEAFRLPHSYGYDRAVVGDVESFELRPSVGGALLFDPRNYHAVAPSFGGRRLALGFAVGLDDRGRLLTWA
jgi:hypothetical protein